jgi:hypothetical protein
MKSHRLGAGIIGKTSVGKLWVNAGHGTLSGRSGQAQARLWQS